MLYEDPQEVRWVCTHLSYDQKVERLETRIGGDRDQDWVSVMRTLFIAWRVKETWADPEGMLATFHVFYESLSQCSDVDVFRS